MFAGKLSWSLLTLKDVIMCDVIVCTVTRLVIAACHHLKRNALNVLSGLMSVMV